MSVLPKKQGDPWPFKEEVVQIDKIKFDHTVQRQLSIPWCEARTYDMVKAGKVILCRRRDGSLWCVDGQHRIMLAKMAGETEIIADVLTGLTRKEEADLRLGYNDRRQDTILEKFRTRLTAGDPVARGIRKVVNDAGGRLASHNATRGTINCIATLEKVYLIDQGETLSTVLMEIRESFGSIDGETATVPAVLGLAHFVRAHPDYDEVRLRSKLGMNNPNGMKAKTLSHKMSNLGPDWLNYYRAILTVYNERLGPEKRLSWVDPYAL